MKNNNHQMKILVGDEKEFIFHKRNAHTHIHKKKIQTNPYLKNLSPNDTVYP